ncbi:hypothetical protein MMC14_002859 [Varicellaria rhodocarpa]|nr:hypothetical protein [Varicellaria rhodocarpa]
MGCDITSLLQEFESRGKVHSRKESNESDPQTRRDLRAAVAKLSIALEDSGDTIDLITYIPLNTVLIGIAIDLGIFQLLLNKNALMSVKELAGISWA